jgi:hypothetical protein
MFIDVFHGGADRSQSRGDFRDELLAFGGQGDAARVVRLNRRTPRRASSAATAWLSAEDDISSSRAATRKPPCRATATTASSSSWLALIALF